MTLDDIWRANRVSREDYEKLCLEYEWSPASDDELGGYGDKYGDWDRLSPCHEKKLRQIRWYTVKEEQPEPPPVLIPRHIPRMEGQLWQECERCGREPSYLPLELCEQCWPKE